MQSETIGKLAEALSKAQSEMESAKKDSTNPHFKSKYADIASIIDAVREPLSKNGLSYSQFFNEDNDKTYLHTRLMHTSGEWISSKLKLLNGKNDMQGLGSAATYARRYSLSAIVGIAQDDDDGNASKFMMTGFEIQRIKELAELAGYTFDDIKKRIKDKLKKDDPLFLSESEFKLICETLKEESSK